MNFLKRIPRIYYFPLLIIALVIILTGFRVNGSSIGMYNVYFYGNKGTDLMIGSPRPIRSDEWLVQTPRILAQYQVSYSDINPLFGTGVNFSTSRLPVRNWTSLFRPQQWGFFFLPIEYAFSLYWWIRGAFLIISFYLILVWITKGNILSSALLAIAFFYSPFFQWWYSAPLIEIVAFSVLLLVVFCRLVNATKVKQLIFYGILFTYLSVCYAILKYPPYQIILVYCMVFLAVGYLLQHFDLLTWSRLKRVIPTFGISLLIIAGIMFFVYFYLRDVITIIGNTIYPGHRFFTGGGLNPLYLFGGFFDRQFLASGRQVPAAFGPNPSEASSFFMVSMFILPVLFYGEVKAIIKRQKPDWIAIAAFAYMVLMSIWVFWGFPKILTNITLLKYVGIRRAMVGFGVINILVIGYYLFRYRMDFNKRGLLIFGAIYAFLIFIAYVYVGWTIRGSNPLFIGHVYSIFIFALIPGILLFLLLVRYQKTFVLLFLAVSVWSTFSVNPISIGLAPILKSDFSTTIQELRKTEPTTAKWVAYDSVILGGFLAANGAPVLDIAYPYPDMKLWQQFDPSQKFIDVYNRQGHAVFQSGDSNQASFTLKQEDLFYVQISPCSPTMKQVGVVFYVFTRPVSYSCLEDVAKVKYPKMPLYVYKRIE